MGRRRMMAKLTEFGKKLSSQEQKVALGLARVAEILRQAAAELYPDKPPWKKWTQAQWDEIYTREDELWAEAQKEKEETAHVEEV